MLDEQSRDGLWFLETLGELLSGAGGPNCGAVLQSEYLVCFAQLHKAAVQGWVPQVVSKQLFALGEEAHLTSSVLAPGCTSNSS